MEILQVRGHVACHVLFLIIPQLRIVLLAMERRRHPGVVSAWLRLACLLAAGCVQLGPASAQQGVYPTGDSLQSVSTASKGTARPPSLQPNYTALGPCTAVTRYTGIPLEVNASPPGSPGCIRAGTQCPTASINLTVTAPRACSAISAPYKTVVMFPGFRTMARNYRTLATRLASWGYVVVQYDRPYPRNTPPSALSRSSPFTPPSEVETTYFDKFVAWAENANEMPGNPLFGTMDLSRIGVVGHSMGGGLASIVAAEHADRVQGVVLLDAVDYTHLSLRVARQFLQSYNNSIAVVTVGVHCVDRTGCITDPLDHQPTPEDAQTFGSCKPDWHCCHWDDGQPGMENKAVAEIAQATDGPSGFVEFAASGSLIVNLKSSGHMDFLDKLSSETFTVDCPSTLPSSAILPDLLPVVVGWMEHKMRGADLGPLAEWAAAPAVQQRLEYSIKGALET